MGLAMQSKAFDWLVLGVLVAIWGSGFAALKIATTYIDPLWNTAIRVAIASATLACVLVAQRQRLPRFDHPAWRAYALIGFFGMADLVVPPAAVSDVFGVVVTR